MSDPTLDPALGRILLPRALTVSLHRSARLAAGLASDAGAPYKGAAPVAPRPSRWAGPVADAACIAAVGAEEALWLGFESPADAEFAVIVRFDAVNALTGSPDPDDALRETPVNFLTLPDQPFLDRVVDRHGARAQWSPGAEAKPQPDGHAALGEVEVILFELAPTPRPPRGIVAEDAAQPDAPAPHRVTAVHPWGSRASAAAVAQARPAARLHVWLVTPQTFTALTGTVLNDADFAGGPAEPVSAYRPF